MRVASDGRAADLFLPVAYSDEDRVFYIDQGEGALGFAFLCDPQPGADPRNKERLQVLLNADWPTDTMLQILLYAGPDIKATVDEYKMLRRRQEHPFLKAATQQRAQFLWDGVDEPVDRQSGMVLRNARLIVTATIPLDEPEPSEAQLDQVRELRNHLGETLKNAGLGPRTLDRHAYLRQMNAMLCHHKEAPWRSMHSMPAEDNALLRDQILDHDVSIQTDRHGMWLGNTRVRTLSPKRFPQAVRFGYAASYLGDMFSGARGIRGRCLFASVLHFPDARKRRDALATKRMYTTNQAAGPLVRFAPRLKRKKQGFDILNEALENGDRPIHLMWSLVLFNDTDEESARAASNAKSYLGERGLYLLEDRFVTRPIFFNCLPLNAEVAAVQNLFRFKTMAAVHATALLPLFADWKGNGAPAMTFVGRLGQLQSFDLFSSHTNYNGVIVAQTGSGKSFLCNEFIVNYLATGAQVRVIDIGYSYKNVCELVDGQYMDFESGARLCLNPFTLIGSFEEEEDSLVSLLMAMSDPQGDTSVGSETYAFQTAELKRLLGDLWHAHGHALNVDEVAVACTSHDDQRMVDLGKRLFPFTSRGQYGAYFNGRNNVDFDNAMTVLELESLKGRAHLQRVVLLQLIYQIQQEMYRGDREMPRLVLIDEAWEHLKNGGSAVANFIEDCYRRARKYGGSILMATQTIGDLHDSDVGRAIRASSAYAFYLGQTRDSIDTAVANGQLSMSQGAIDLLKSVRTEKGRYSEIFVHAGDSMGIARLIVEPFRKVAFANDPQTPPEIARRRRQGMAIGDAIASIAEEREQQQEVV